MIPELTYGYKVVQNGIRIYRIEFLLDQLKIYDL
jgi:hypothetical protein